MKGVDLNLKKRMRLMNHMVLEEWLFN